MVSCWKLFRCIRMPKNTVKSSKVVPITSTESIHTITMSTTSTLDVATLEQQQQDHETRPTVEPEMQAPRRNLLWHLLLDLPILLLVLAVGISLELGVIPSRRSGFLCNDPALSYPYTGDTFSIMVVIEITILVPFFIMWVVEGVLHREDEYSAKKNKFCGSAKSAGLIFKDYIFGAVVNLTIVEVLKCAFGSPRPTFFELCEPDAAKTCNGSQYIASYECTSTTYSKYLKLDSSRSFPSGHSSIAIYTGIFLAWYLQRRAFSWHNRSVLVVPFVQIICITYAGIVPLSRLTDHRHHWWDVLFGSLLGLVSVVHTILVLCKNFSCPSVVSTSDISSSDGNNHQSVRRLLASQRSDQAVLP